MKMKKAFADWAISRVTRITRILHKHTTYVISIPYAIGTILLVVGIIGLKLALVGNVTIESCPIEFHLALIGLTILIVASIVQVLLDTSNSRE